MTRKHQVVIIIEPDDLVRELLERWLGEAGYTVIARSLEELSETNPGAVMPALVTLDMPNPREAQKIVEFVRGLYPSPILALSARFQRNLRSSTNLARQLGVRSTLPKPFTRGALFAAVRKSIESHSP